MSIYTRHHGHGPNALLVEPEGKAYNLQSTLAIFLGTFLHRILSIHNSLGLLVFTSDFTFFVVVVWFHYIRPYDRHDCVYSRRAP